MSQCWKKQMILSVLTYWERWSQWKRSQSDGVCELNFDIDQLHSSDHSSWFFCTIILLHCHLYCCRPNMSRIGRLDISLLLNPGCWWVMSSVPDPQFLFSELFHYVLVNSVFCLICWKGSPCCEYLQTLTRFTSLSVVLVKSFSACWWSKCCIRDHFTRKQYGSGWNIEVWNFIGMNSVKCGSKIYI